MLIRDYQYISKLDTGKTYEDEMIKYFKIPTNRPLEEVRKDLEKKTEIKEKKTLKKWWWFKGKIWTLHYPFTEETYDQWNRLETLLAEENNIQNLHKLLAIYFRPKRFFFFNKKFSMKDQDKIENDLLDFDMDWAQTIALFFSLSATKYMRNMNIYYLNQMKQKSVASTNHK